jgi:hypothetical protein
MVKEMVSYTRFQGTFSDPIQLAWMVKKILTAIMVLAQIAYLHDG